MEKLFNKGCWHDYIWHPKNQHKLFFSGAVLCNPCTWEAVAGGWWVQENRMQASMGYRKNGSQKDRLPMLNPNSHYTRKETGSRNQAEVRGIHPSDLGLFRKIFLSSFPFSYECMWVHMCVGTRRWVCMHVEAQGWCLESSHISFPLSSLKQGLSIKPRAHWLVSVANLFWGSSISTFPRLESQIGH